MVNENMYVDYRNVRYDERFAAQPNNIKCSQTIQSNEQKKNTQQPPVLIHQKLLESHVACTCTRTELSRLAVSST